MRTALVLGGTLALLAAARPAAAQPPQSPSGPGQEVAVASEVYVYSGPGDGLYPTGKLRPGQQVRVLGRKDSDWLAIKPPPDSFSYVDSRFVLQVPNDPRQALVTVLDSDLLPVYAGSTIETAKEPNVECAKLKRGSIVVVLQNHQKYATSRGTTLLPIEPWPEEVRYIKASAVAPSGVTVAAAGAGQPAGAGPDPLLQQVQRLSQQAQDPSLDLAKRQQALMHLKEAEALLQKPQTAQGNVAPTQMPGHPGAAAGTPGQLVSNPNQRPQQQNTVLYNNSVAAAPAAPAAPPGMRYSGWGVLQRTSFQKDGQSMYKLIDPQQKLLLYASPEPGKTLEPYVGQMVNLYGTVAYRSDEFIRMDFMTVYYVAGGQAKAGH
jgi:hypothetical protein